MKTTTISTDYLVLNEDSIQKNVQITIVNNKIKEIKKINGYENKNESKTVIFPGFINAHTHLQFSLYRSFLDKKKQIFLIGSKR